jgi:putative proteasome-type protease
MTYCLGIINQSGLVIAADSRTNAGVDYISTYQKLFDYVVPGERVILICTSGNLSVTQAALHAMNRDIKIAADDSLFTQPTMYDVARYVGRKLRVIEEQDRQWLEQDNIDFRCTLLVGGQIHGEEAQLFRVYSQGNCIQATAETPYLQVGETKYGKPILDRTLKIDTPLESVAKCALLSIDSTMRSNISVGPPINLVMYESDTFEIRHQLKLRIGDPYLAKIRQMWEASLKEIFDRMPEIDWEHYLEDDSDQDVALD